MHKPGHQMAAKKSFHPWLYEVIGVKEVTV